VPLSNPIISRVAPVKVGGAANAGVGWLASAFDHSHPLIETAGPTNLSMGSILDNEAVRRVAANLVGRQIQVARLTVGPAVNSTTAMADVGSQLNFDLKANEQYLVCWVVYYQTAATSTPIRLAMSYSGTLNSGTRTGLLGAQSPTAFISGVGTVDDVGLGAASAGPGSTDVVALVGGMVRTLLAGTLALRFRSGAASSSVTVQNGTHGLLVQI